MFLRGDKGEIFFHKKNCRGQITIFIIIAILIIAGASIFFVFRDSFGIVKIPASIEPVYNTFLTCLEENVLLGVDILESQAGYISLPEFEPGSVYMPFSSQLDFLGNPIPYWYYVSGNNIQKEQIPSESDMEMQLEEFVEGEIRKCRFDSYYDQGFEITLSEPKADVDINDNEIKLSLNMDLSVNKNEDSVIVRKHKIDINSNLGGLYNSAKKIYDYEQETLFLENYAVDTLRLYAPVDGIELKCSPLIWNADEVFDELQKAIESNTLALKTKGGVFSLNGGDKYFVSDISLEHDIRFLNSPNWPSGFEVSPSEDSILMASPVGTQPGLGTLGFCYVPYHFVYNIRYPVLVQVFSEDEIFQFPIAVVVQGNRPREALKTSDAIEVEIPELCEQKNTLTKVNTFDTKLNNINTNISYECSGTKCDIGETSFGLLEKEFPQCVNGFVIAKAEGFKDAKQIYSVVKSGNVDLFLNRLYELNVRLKLDNLNYDGQATISFISDDGFSSRTIVYPQQKTIELSEGQYEIQVYMYRNSSLNIDATTTRKCVEVPQTGIGGFFGFTKENCFNIEFPAQTLSSALSGGGNQNYFVLESELESSNTIEINTDSLPLPNTLKQLQENYILLEDKSLDIIFK